MRFQRGCIECVHKQANKLIGFFGVDDTTWLELQKDILSELAGVPDTMTAPVLAKRLADIVKAKTGKGDPFLSIRQRSNAEMEKVYPFIKRRILFSADRLKASIIASALGNSIDFGIPDNTYTPEEIRDDFIRLIKAGRNKRAFEIDDYELLKDHIHKARTILFIADNAGEIVLDRLLIEWMLTHLKGAGITLCVRGAPTINDAIIDDAQKHILGKLSQKALSRLRIIDTGSDVPGADLAYASEGFKKAFNEADVIISKGQGNFEVLEGTTDSNGDPKDIYFIFKVKCGGVADYVSAKKGSLILYKNRHSEW
ncbi:MAG: DUF89 family protein [Deltaproteobacteria bacterium]|nr:DUF89 family protein [Candidatus Zymogenaceae bacterium]